MGHYHEMTHGWRFEKIDARTKKLRIQDYTFPMFLLCPASDGMHSKTRCNTRQRWCSAIPYRVFAGPELEASPPSEELIELREAVVQAALRVVRDQDVLERVPRGHGLRPPIGQIRPENIFMESFS